MKLIGKTREDFYNWYENAAHISKFNKTRQLTILHFIAQSETCKNALIIEFFDLVGIYIEVSLDKHRDRIIFDACVDNEWIGTSFKTRNEATNEAIIKANEIFNKNNTWYNEAETTERMNIIGQNGNSGEHYEDLT